MVVVCLQSVSCQGELAENNLGRSLMCPAPACLNEGCMRSMVPWNSTCSRDRISSRRSPRSSRGPSSQTRGREKS